GSCAVCGRRPTGPCSNACVTSAPSRWRSAWSSRGRSSRLRGCRPASTWRSDSSPASAATTSRGASSSASSTTPNHPSTRAPRARRPRTWCSSCARRWSSSGRNTPHPAPETMPGARVLPLVRRRTRPAGRDARRVAVVAFPDAEVLDVTGPHEVFAQAAGFLPDRAPGYTVEILTSGASPLVCSSGVKLVPDRSIHEVHGGMDLALALVEEDHGRELALRVARQLVMFLKRPGGQSQFSAQLAVQAADRDPLRELQAWIADHLDTDLSVPTLAAEVAMSERNFARVFTREVGLTP